LYDWFSEARRSVVWYFTLFYSMYRETFSNRHVVLPVIHVETETQTLRNAEVAYQAGCDGVFLINHTIPAVELWRIQRKVCREFSDWWIGVNCLDLKPDEVFETISDEVAGVWVDNAMIDERQAAQPEAEAVLAIQERRGWRGLYFGGGAFKYQRAVEDVGRAAHIAARYMDVVTTSGPATGQAADREKILTMKQALGDAPLAIASGISPANVQRYLDIADCFLVATAISRSPTDFDPALVRELVEIVRAY
jgi:hypothetical protein